MTFKVQQKRHSNQINKDYFLIECALLKLQLDNNSLADNIQETNTVKNFNFSMHVF